MLLKHPGLFVCTPFSEEPHVAEVTDTQIAEWALELEQAPADRVLAWAAERFAPCLAFATGFGAEGCVLVHLIASARLPIDIFTLDTGVLFRETYQLWWRLECRYDVHIRGVEPALTLPAQADAHGPALWARDPYRCCAIRKVAPLAKERARLDAWITAIRRDQTSDRAGAGVVERDPSSGLVKINPLARWSRDEVWAFIREQDVPYNPLHDRGYPSIGCEPCTTPVADGEDPRAGRWRGRAKTECGLHLPGSAAPVTLFVQRPEGA